VAARLCPQSAIRNPKSAIEELALFRTIAPRPARRSRELGLFVHLTRVLTSLPSASNHHSSIINHQSRGPSRTALSLYLCSVLHESGRNSVRGQRPRIAQLLAPTGIKKFSQPGCFTFSTIAQTMPGRPQAVGGRPEGGRRGTGIPGTHPVSRTLHVDCAGVLVRAPAPARPPGAGCRAKSPVGARPAGAPLRACCAPECWNAKRARCRCYLAHLTPSQLRCGYPWPSQRVQVSAKSQSMKVARCIICSAVTERPAPRSGPPPAEAAR